VTEIIPGVHDVDLSMVHAYLYQERDRLTLIDTGLADSAMKIVDAIEGIDRKVTDLRQIIVTHYHADHTGSLAELAERSRAQVLAHALDAPVVCGDLPEAEPDLSELEKKLQTEISKGVRPARSCPVDRQLIGGDEIDLDGGARVVHVPGHTAGSIAIYAPKQRALFVGDAAARMPDGRLLSGVFNVDRALTRASFRHLAELDFEAAFFGHGAPMDRDASLEFRRQAERLRD